MIAKNLRLQRTDGPTDEQTATKKEKQGRIYGYQVTCRWAGAIGIKNIKKKSVTDGWSDERTDKAGCRVA